MADDKKAEPVDADPEQTSALAEGLVKMFKDDVRLFVHSTCVATHVAVGWHVA